MIQRGHFGTYVIVELKSRFSRENLSHFNLGYFIPIKKQNDGPRLLHESIWKHNVEKYKEKCQRVNNYKDVPGSWCNDHT